MSTNGLVSFNDGISSYDPEEFPIEEEPLIAVFWSDVDTEEAGEIMYR